MDIGIKYLPHEETNLTVTRHIAKVLHSEEFAPQGHKINFTVRLKPSPGGGIRNNGTGVLTVPTITIGKRFLEHVTHEPFKIKGKKVGFFTASHSPAPWESETLLKTPFIDPDFEEKRLEKLSHLSLKLRLAKLQIGTFFRTGYPTGGKKTPLSRAFSVEWEKELIQKSYGDLEFDYDKKLLRFNLGAPHADIDGHIMSIRFRSIRKMAMGYDPNPYICIDNDAPPIIEKLSLNRTLTGDRRTDNRKFKERVSSLDPSHAIISPFASQIRVLVFDDRSMFGDPTKDVLQHFEEMCRVANLNPEGRIIRVPDMFPIDATKREFFSRKRMHTLRLKLKQLEWPVAFQIEALLHNGLLNTDDIDTLLPEINRLCLQHQRNPAFVPDFLNRYHSLLSGRTEAEASIQSPVACFRHALTHFRWEPLHRDNFQCHHLTVTPTRMILEGPIPSDSNRIVRKYRQFEDHFIRVDFKDEDRLSFRWDEAVDGSPLLQTRVGETLKNGFELGGRKFEFLAYSNSALKEHSVWFIHPFTEKGKLVDGEFIRQSTGDFSQPGKKGEELLKTPSKYAARIAQAFTATVPSVDILRCEWEVVDDLGSGSYLHTDGVGTISLSLAIRIWMKLCQSRGEDVSTDYMPSAYQIRFLGFKGVVCVDNDMEKVAPGTHMRLRPSMEKFHVSEAAAARAPLEIAQFFLHASKCFLNRPLVMLLEDLGVRQENFLDLQKKAIADLNMIDDSLDNFNSVLSSSRLGYTYRLRWVYTRLQEKYGLDFKETRQLGGVEHPFLEKIRDVVVNDALRDMKFSARIPVPESYLLVGVADEGPSYKGLPGYGDVFCLREMEIYVCIQGSADEKPHWIEGSVAISRNPVVHPGDVQRVFAIGEPPDNAIFKHLKNVVVLPSVGPRSLASYLGGGDVDGDQFAVICYDPILPTLIEEPAAYPPIDPYELPDGRTVQVADICDFVVRFIESEVLGLLSDRWLLIADQALYGVKDEDCLHLAKLCSDAVDFQKHGNALNIDVDGLPRTRIRCKPDWHADEFLPSGPADESDVRYYTSDRALGHLFRAIPADTCMSTSDGDGGVSQPCLDTLSEPITMAILPDIEKYLDEQFDTGMYDQRLLNIFQKYVDELNYICSAHTLSTTPGVKLSEAEVVVGTILATSARKNLRKDRIQKMRTHAAALVTAIKKTFIDDIGSAQGQELLNGLETAWKAWLLSLRRRNTFGANSFGMIALSVIFDCLDKLQGTGL